MSPKSAKHLDRRAGNYQKDAHAVFDDAVSSGCAGSAIETEGQPGYDCVVSSELKAFGGRVNEDMSGVYTFGESVVSSECYGL